MGKTTDRFPLFTYMQQYFCNKALKTGEEYVFDRQQAHHAKTVLHLDHETVRLVYQGKGYFATCYQKGNEFVGLVEREDPRNNELPCEITLAIALIRREKFEWILQKATELGVSRIVPFESSRCVVHARKEKAGRQKERWETIVQSAAEQCKRNRIPEITDIANFSDLHDLKAELKVCAYENAYGNSRFLSKLYQGQRSVTVVIGPEGGFSESEVEQLVQSQYVSCTLGSRILRAETAALYSLSVLAEMSERGC